ncbi:hypothetical protein PENTCL1PPCAC_3873, partial [Pristionchus entomophagus]
STLAILILLGCSIATSGFLFGHQACGCPPPPPPPPKCDCACGAQQQQYPQQVAYAAAPAPYYAPVAAAAAPQYAPPLASSASAAYDAAIDNAALNALGDGGAASAGYQGPARGAYATGGAQQIYPSTAQINGFPSSEQSGYAQAAQSSSVYGNQQSQYAQPSSASAGVYGAQQSAYAQPQQQSGAVYGQQQESYGQQGYAKASSAAVSSSPYTLSYPSSQAQTQYVNANTPALNAFAQSIASQPLSGGQASYARPSAAVSNGLPASTIQYATVPAGVAVDQHLARQIANEAATYVSADGNQYVQAKQNAYARQHNPTVNEYARVGGVEGGSAVREQYMTRPEPIPASTYVNTNLNSKKPSLVLPVIVSVPQPPPLQRAQFSEPSDDEIIAAERADPIILATAAQHDAPPLSRPAPQHSQTLFVAATQPPAPAQQTIIETVDTTSLVLPTDDILVATDAAEVSESVRHLNTMSAADFEQALQRAELVEEDHAPVAVKASVKEEPKQHSVVQGESEFQGSPLTEENLLEGNVLDNEVEHNTDPEEPQQEQQQEQETEIQKQQEPESETLTDTPLETLTHLSEGLSIKARVHAAPTAQVPHRDFGLARH